MFHAHGGADGRICFGISVRAVARRQAIPLQSRFPRTSICGDIGVCQWCRAVARDRNVSLSVTQIRVDRDVIAIPRLPRKTRAWASAASSARPTTHDGFVAADFTEDRDKWQSSREASRADVNLDFNSRATQLGYGALIRVVENALWRRRN